MGFDIYAEVTDRIISEMEKGIIPWERPWTGTLDGAISHSTGKPYSLINQFLLGKPGEWLTWKQIQDEGGKVKKGSKARMVVFWKILNKEQTKDGAPVLGDDGKPKAKLVPVLRYYNVFHIDDCEGIEPKVKEGEMHAGEPIEAAEKTLNDYVAREGIKLILEKGNRAFYRPADDEIHLPLFEQFEKAAEFYSTAFHEATHSTGHPKRLARIKTGLDAASFGDESYSKEELVAEIGACSIMHRLGIETESNFRNSAGYLQSWIKALKNDKHLLISAASKAEKAVEMIMPEVGA